MKKCLTIFSTLILTILLTISLVGCGALEDPDISTEIGGEAPDIETKHKINGGMTALEMFTAGIKNYDEADYASVYQSSMVHTEQGLFINQTQSVYSRKVKDSNKYYVDNYGYTVEGIYKCNLMDEAVMDDKGMRVRKTTDVTVKDGAFTANKWNATQYFDTVDEFLAVNPSDPRRAIMLNVNENSVISMSKPQYDNKMKQYSFTITLDPVKSTGDYYNVVLGQLNSQNFDNPSVRFTSMSVNVVMWDSGLLRSVEMLEEYLLNGRKVITLKDVPNVGRTSFNYSYDRKDMPISGLIKF